MTDQFNLSISENIFLAKKLLVKNIYNSAKLEGLNVTFVETQTILDGVSVDKMKISDVEVILNLRDAWRYLLSHIDRPLNLEYLMKINEFVARNESLDWGVLRYGDIGISGVDYTPSIPVEKTVREELSALLQSHQTVTEKALRLFLWGCRSQLFWDGNKRTSFLVANKLLISEGKGILVIEEKDLKEFNQELSHFYETNSYESALVFLSEKCIQGIHFSPEKESTLAKLEKAKQKAAMVNPSRRKNKKPDLER